MTNKEALLSLFAYSQGADLVLINQGIDGTADYTSSAKKDIEIASAYLMLAAATNPNLKEGDNSITWNAENLIKMANQIFLKYGLTDEIVESKTVEFKQKEGEKKRTLAFGDDGICEACRYAERKKKINWEEREKYWIASYENLLNQHEGGKGVIIDRTFNSIERSANGHHKSVCQITDDGVLIKQWISIKEATLELGLKSKSSKS